jgi:hypothetical protein
LIQYGKHVYARISKERKLNKMITIEEEISYLTEKYPNWRKGQIVFNAAFMLDPDKANLLRGGEVDCFYDDSKIDLFLQAFKKIKK